MPERDVSVGGLAPDGRCAGFQHDRGEKRGEGIGFDGFKKIKGTKLHAVVTADGIPLGVTLSAANDHDSTHALETVEVIRLKPSGRGRPRTRVGRLHADPAYDSGEIRSALRRRGIRSNIPANRRNRKTPKRGRPFGLDKPAYRTIRSAVERFNGWIKNFRRITIRYERRLDCFAAFVHLACFLITSGVLR
jgi:transposase